VIAAGICSPNAPRPCRVGLHTPTPRHAGGDVADAAPGRSGLCRSRSSGSRGSTARKPSAAHTLSSCCLWGLSSESLTA
jgi:hypothetical protein